MAYITQKKADIRNKTKTSSKRVGNNFVFGGKRVEFTKQGRRQLYLHHSIRRKPL